MENLKLVHQLFIGKVADEIGMERTAELLKEAKEAFAIPVVVGRSELLVNFLLYLNDKELINNHDFSYEKEAKTFLKKITNCTNGQE